MSADLPGDVAQVFLRSAYGDTAIWDNATAAERDEMRAVAAKFVPIIERTAERLAAWLDEVAA